MALSKILPASQEQYAGARNLIINGSCAISQRGVSTSFAHDGTTTAYTVDRFEFTISSNHETFDCTVTQDSDAPDGFSNSIKITTGTEESNIASDEFVFLRQRIEGQNLQHLKYGTSEAVSTTVSFYVKSSQTGTFGISMYSADGNRNIGTTYTINSANTWEYKTLTFAGDVSGTINNDNGDALNVIWHLSSGSDFDSTDNTSWGAYSNARWAYGHAQDGVITTAGATFQITGVQLEVGEATPFEHRSFQDEIIRCKRYYQKSFPYDTAPFNNAGQGGARWDERTAVMPPNSYNTSTYIGAWCHLSVPMRTTPTTTQYNTNTLGTSGSYLNDLQNSGVSTSYSILATSHNTEKLHFYVGGVHSQGNTFGVNWEADAEL